MEVTAPGGFDGFVATHERRLREALTASLGAEGRDAAVDALGYAWEHWERVSTMANPVGYLFVVARDRSRREQRRRLRPVPVDLPVPDGMPWCEPALASLLRTLPERERVVVLLLHGLGWSQGEVAELLGIAKSTVQTHAERALAKLRTGLGVAR